MVILGYKGPMQSVTSTYPSSAFIRRNLHDDVMRTTRCRTSVSLEAKLGSLSVVPVQISIVVEVAPWIRCAIHKLRRPFIWSGSDQVQGGKCLVAWSKVTRPAELGGLGVVDLATMGYTLRLRWAWLACTEPERLWASVQLVTGSRALFWVDHWMQGESM
jgi:hypothetical protein